MTKKQYVKKVRNLQRKLAKYAKEKMGKTLHTADRVNTPIWGAEIKAGKHAGEIMRSYAQAWDILEENLGPILQEEPWV